MAFSGLKEISAVAATSPLLVRRNERNLWIDCTSSFSDNTTDISYAPTFLAELLQHNAAEIHPEEITAFSQIAKKIDTAHKTADALNVTAGRDDNFIRILGDHKLALKSLNNAYANHERLNSQYKTLLIRAERARAAKNQVELDQIQKLILTTLKDREIAENALFAAFEKVSNLGKTNQVSEANLSGAKSALGSSESGPLTENQKTELQKYRDSVTGLNNIDFNEADATDQVNNLLAKQKTNIDTLKAATSDGIWDLTCTTETSGEFTRSRIENRRRNEKDLQNQIEQNSALRNELKLEMARSKEESSHAETALNRAIERTNGSPTDIDLIKRRKDLNKKAQNIANAHNEISTLISQVEKLENDITTNTAGGVTNWDAISTDGSNKTLKARLIEINNAYGRVRTSQEKQTGNIFDSLGGFNNLIENLDTDTGGVAKTNDTIWAGLQSEMTHVETNASLLGEEANTVLGDLIVIDSKIFESCHNDFVDLNIYHNNLIQEKEQISALNLDSLLSRGLTSGYLFDINTALLPFAPTGTPPAPHNIPATDQQVQALKDSLGALVNYVESLGAENISDAHRTQLEGIRNRAQAIIDDNGVVNHATVNTLLTDTTKFHTDRSKEAEKLTEEITSKTKEISDLTGLIGKNSELKTAKENLQAAQIKETSLKAFEAALGALGEAQTPEQFKALEDKLNELEAKLQSTGDTSLQSQIDALKEQIKTGADGKGGEKGANGKDGGGMGWPGWLAIGASTLAGVFGVTTGLGAQKKSDEQKKKFEATMAQLDQRLSDLQQMTMGTAQSVNRINNGLQKATRASQVAVNLANEAKKTAASAKKVVANNIVNRRRKKQLANS